MTVNPRRVVLEPAAQAFLEMTAALPRLDALAPVEGRRVVDRWQAEPITCAVTERWVTLDAAQAGHVRVRIVSPLNSSPVLPVVIYVHGGGWVFGGMDTHGRLVRELVMQSGAAVVFPEYSLSPEARYPHALIQICVVARWVLQDGARYGLDASRVAVCGDGVGATMAIALVRLCLQRNQTTVKQFVGLCPVTDASCDTESHRIFGEGYHLRSATMRWCWDQYISDRSNRLHPTVSPLHTSIEELAGFPPSLIITAEADVVRDEGEAFAAKLRAADVPTTAVRYDAVIHGFVVVNALSQTNAARAAIAQAVSALTAAFDR